MTWAMWGTTLRGLTIFEKTADLPVLDFEVREVGIQGVVGSGLFILV